MDLDSIHSIQKDDTKVYLVTHNDLKLLHQDRSVPSWAETCTTNGISEVGQGRK